MKPAFTILLGLAVGCGAFEKHEPKESTPSAELADLYSSRLDLYNEATSADGGWPSVVDCDATLWAGVACAGGAPVAISRAEYSPGVIHRRPASACWNSEQGDVGSRSTVSNDMLLGYMFCAWSNKDRAAFERLANYGEAKDWVMGEPLDQVGDVILKPNQIGMAGRALYLLSAGEDDRYYRRLFRYYAPVEQDYERHLQAIGIILQGEITEALRKADLDSSVDAAGLLDIDGEMKKRLEEIRLVEPENPLFAVALGVYTGDMGEAVSLLLRGDDVPRPTYVRSKGGVADDLYWQAEWLLAARTALKRMNH